MVKALTSAFIGRAGGADIRIEQGEEWPADDPVVKANPTLFERPARKPKSAKD